MIVERLSIFSPYIADGRVNYDKLKKDNQIQSLITEIETIDPRNSDYNTQLAFWLNAYNLLTIKSVLKNLEKNPKWEGNTNIWRKIKFFILARHQVGGIKINLYNLENKILRKKFKDARIHFAINCGSMSCPRLPSKLFDPETLEEQLEELTHQFINSNEVEYNEKNNILYVSKIFEMYKSDFGGIQGIVNFIIRYRKRYGINKNTKIVFKPYNWRINSVSLAE